MGFDPGKIARQASRLPGKGVREIEHLSESAAGEVVALVEAALQEALKAAQRGVLRQALRVLDAAAPDRVDLHIGPVGLWGINVRERIASIRHAAHNPPQSKADIRALVLALAPREVSVTLSAELALVLVASQSLSVGMTLTWEAEGFVGRFEKALEAL